ncbi:hypothetical protein BJ944DRAFT_227516 [Cunninghamella echinulata]|nr:hypothetical protein BJ944DRAFT_227516 [Cunninghamella echinulata]
MDSFYFGLDPLFWVHVKVFISDILALNEATNHKNVYKFNGHVIRSVDICGIIIGVEQKYNSVTYTIDDSTGTIACRLWRESAVMENSLSLGTCIQVTGYITNFRNKRLINVQDLNHITDPNMEILHYLQVLDLKKNHYSEPFQVPQPIIENIESIKEEIKMENGTNAHIITLSQDTSNIIDRQGYQRFLLQYIKDTYGEEPFEINYLQQTESLYRMAKPLLQHELRQEPTKEQLDQLIIDSVNQLHQQQDLINVRNMATCYQAINEDSRLIKTIEKVIRETMNQNNNEYSSFDLGGIRKNFIHTKTREILPSHPESKIDECLNKMVENSTLYLTGPYEYRLLE